MPPRRPPATAAPTPSRHAARRAAHAAPIIDRPCLPTQGDLP
ncbi:hypothetical protein BSIN_4272 [Burkholderia singularis]|uniref:Uncharacterized protein n=1 Tax=Burkholderia singularis TaxID=1503053 RepID=A0A238H7Q9_9BURK|nr:hypothetical protein BSIN_4272 [Burkholderia singularis]